MRIDITEKNMVWLVEHKMADTIVAEFHRKEAVIESLVQDYARLKTEVERLTKVECQFAVSSEGEKSDQSDKIGKITFGFNTLAEFERDVESARQMIPLILAAAKEGKPSV